MSSTIPPVRILPMDSREEPDFAGRSAEQVQQQYFLQKLVQPDRPPGKYWYRKLGLKAHPGTIVLFQFAGEIIASASLDAVEPFEQPEGPFHGALYFDPGSIKVFDPLGPDAISEIWPEFKGFSHAKWSLDPMMYSAFEKRLTGVQTPKLQAVP